MKSAERKDYGIFSEAVDILPKLARFCYLCDFQMTGDQKEGYAYVTLEIDRVGEAVLDDRFAFQCVCEKILLMDTMVVPFKDNPEYTFPLKMTEFTILTILARLALDRNKINAVYPVASLLTSGAHCLYRKIRGLELPFQDRIVNFLLTMPEEIVDWGYSLNESKIRTKYGRGDLVTFMLAREAKMYLRYRAKKRETMGLPY